MAAVSGSHHGARIKQPLGFNLLPHLLQLRPQRTVHSALETTRGYANQNKDKLHIQKEQKQTVENSDDRHTMLMCCCKHLVFSNENT